MISEVNQNFLDAFSVALSVDGDTHNFAFSDGVTTGGRLYAEITCLWVKEVSAYLQTHTHDYNSVVNKNERVCLFLASEVPDSATLYTNDYLDVDEVSYRIVSARLKDSIWTLQLSIIGTT